MSAEPIVTILSAPLPPGATREQLRAAFLSTVNFNGAMPDILQKYYTYDASSGTLGSVYLWRTRAAAEAFFVPGWDDRFAARWGTRPTLQTLEALVVLRPLADPAHAAAQEAA